MAQFEHVTWNTVKLNSILDVCTLNLLGELFKATLENEMTMRVNCDTTY